MNESKSNDQKLNNAHQKRVSLGIDSADVFSE